MSWIFHAYPQSSGYDAWHGNGDIRGYANGTVVNEALAGALFNRVWSLAYSSYTFANINWGGRDNLPTSRSRVYHIRLRPGYSGTPASFVPFFSLGTIAPAINAAPLRVDFGHGNDGNLHAYINQVNGNGIIITSTSLGAFSPTAGTVYDIELVWDGTSSANSIKTYVDGVLLAQATPLSGRSWSDPVERDLHPTIALGVGFGVVGTQIRVEEFAINDDASTDLSGFTGASRTTNIINIPAKQGISWPPESQVNDEINWYEYGELKSGNVIVPNEDDVRAGVTFGSESYLTGNLALPSENNVINGIQYGSQGIEFIGNSELPIENNVLSEIGYGSNGIEFIGNLSLPDESDVLIGIDYGPDFSMQGTLESTNPGENNVLDGVLYKINSEQFEGNVTLPLQAFVLEGTLYGPNDSLVGNLVIPGSLPPATLVIILEESTSVYGISGCICEDDFIAIIDQDEDIVAILGGELC